MMRLTRCAALLTCVSTLGLGSVGMASAEPDNCRTVTYEFTDCTSGPDFEAVKQLGQAAALHLVSGPVRGAGRQIDGGYPKGAASEPGSSSRSGTRSFPTA